MCSFKNAYEKTRKDKMRYDTDFGSFHLRKDSERPKKVKIQTLARSIYEKTPDEVRDPRQVLARATWVAERGVR